MSFRASLSTIDKHNVWYRAVYILSSIEETMNMTITNSEIILWTVNTTFTTLCQVRFSSSFFDQYEFKPYEIMFGDDGLQIMTDSHGVDHKFYSIQFTAKYLATISKRPEKEAISKFSIAINNSSTCPDSLINRLLVYVEMESMISKEYSHAFNPVKYDPVLLSLKYKRMFLNAFGSAAKSDSSDGQLNPASVEVFNAVEHELATTIFDEDEIVRVRRKEELTNEDEINFISFNQALIRSFMENCNVGLTNDMELKVNSKTFVLTAFTKEIVAKNGDLLRNAVRSNNSFSVNNLDHCCLFSTTPVNEYPKKKNADQKVIIFKAKDFKNFVSMANVWGGLQGNNYNSIAMWFRLPGDPIVMEMSKGGVKIELCEVTDGVMGTVANVQLPAPATYQEVTVASPSRNEGKNKHPSREKAALKMNYLRDERKLQPISPKIRDSRVSPLKNTGVHVDSTTNIAELANKQYNPRQLFVRESSGIDDDYQREKYVEENGSNPNVSNIFSDFAEQTPVNVPLERQKTTIEWGKRRAETQNPPEQRESKRQIRDQRSVLTREKKRYVQESAEDNEEDENEMQLGPTQRAAPKGLFD